MDETGVRGETEVNEGDDKETNSKGKRVKCTIKTF